MRKHLLLMLLWLALACNFPVGGQAPAAPERQETPDAPPEAAFDPKIDPATSSPFPIVPIPVSDTQIEGFPYNSYQTPGEAFRFVCPNPCPVDPQLIFAQYAGFHGAYEILIRLTGVDALPELQPVDIHIASDEKCGKFEEMRNIAYANHDPTNGAFVCSFIFEYSEGPGGSAYAPGDAVRLDRQAIMIHEYAHTLFFGRLPGSVDAFHDFVTPLALFVWMDWRGEDFFCGYHPPTPPGDFDGYLLWQLCQQNGFHTEQLAPALIELDALYQSGGGQLDEGFRRPVPTMNQFREILSRILGSDTSQAFMDACWPGVIFNEDYSLPPSCTIRTPWISPTPLS
jgi:hypothetical protein